VLISLTGNADKLVAARNTMVGEWKGFTFESLANLLGSRFFLSIIIVYLLMAALYESWLYPFVIMFSVPMAIFGGFLGLSVARWGTLLTTNQPVQQLDVLTFLGFVILVGIVVNNAILLVNQSLIHMREQGMESHLAIREAVRIRVRPVLMTSLTTFFGQLPLAVFPGAGSELYRGLASVMLGGLIVATVGTLILVPTVLSVVTDIRTRLAHVVRGPAAVPAPRDG
jgi:HAE1 family hydrophobic/amphiphilic exporter-1